MSSALSRAKLIQYGQVAIPLSFAGLPIYLHAPDFYASGVGMPLEVIGGALLLLRLVDAIQDPLIGDLSDRFYEFRDKIILAGAFMLAGGLWMIFHPPEILPILWLCTSVFICTTGFSVVTINIQALGGLWEVKPKDVPRVMGTREGLGLCGLLIASITPSILLSFFSTRTVFHFVTLGFIPLIAVSIWLFLRWMKSVTIAKPKRSSPVSFRELFGGRRIRLFLVAYFFASVATSIPATLIIFYVRDYLGAESYLGLFLLVYFLSGAVAMPLWIKLARRTSTLTSWWLSLVLAFLTFIWAYLINPGNIMGYGIVCLASGIAVGANLTMPSAIVAETLTEKSHQRAASRYYALIAFLAKCSLALATGIALPLLGWMGYQPGVVSTSNLLPSAYAVIPSCILVVAILVLGKLIYLLKQSQPLSAHRY